MLAKVNYIQTIEPHLLRTFSLVEDEKIHFNDALIFAVFIVASSARSIHRYELGERYYYLKALKQQEAAARNKNYYRPVDDYRFGYSINDRYTGSDGYKQAVDYTADNIHGYNAYVQKLPINFVPRHFNAPFGSVPSPFVASGPYTQLLGTVAPPTFNFGSSVNKYYPIVNNDLNTYVSDYFNGYTEGSFDQYY